MDPVPQDDVTVCCLGLEGVVVQRAHLLERTILGVTEIEDGPHAAGAEVGRHLGLGVVARLRVPGRALLGQLLVRLQRIAAPRSPVRMDVDDLHGRSLSPRPVFNRPAVTLSFTRTAIVPVNPARAQPLRPIRPEHLGRNRTTTNGCGISILPHYRPQKVATGRSD